MVEPKVCVCNTESSTRGNTGTYRSGKVMRASMSALIIKNVDESEGCKHMHNFPSVSNPLTDLDV